MCREYVLLWYLLTVFVGQRISSMLIEGDEVPKHLSRAVNLQSKSDKAWFAGRKYWHSLWLCVVVLVVCQSEEKWL
jgi:hypothetical protein